MFGHCSWGCIPGSGIVGQGMGCIPGFHIVGQDMGCIPGFCIVGWGMGCSHEIGDCAEMVYRMTLLNFQMAAAGDTDSGIPVGAGNILRAEVRAGSILSLNGDFVKS